MNPPKLLLDENLSPAIALTLTREGFDVVHVRDRGLARAWFTVSSPGGIARDPAVARRDAQTAYEQLLQHVARRFMSADGFMGRVLADRRPADIDE